MLRTHYQRPIDKVIKYSTVVRRVGSTSLPKPFCPIVLQLFFLLLGFSSHLPQRLLSQKLQSRLLLRLAFHSLLNQLYPFLCLFSLIMTPFENDYADTKKASEAPGCCFSHGRSKDKLNSS